MIRRDFIKGIFMGITISYATLRVRRYFVYEKEIDLKSYYDSEFSDISNVNAISKNELYIILKKKNVLSFWGNVDVDRLKELAIDEKLVDYNQYFYTETELYLYALAYRS